MPRTKWSQDARQDPLGGCGSFSANHRRTEGIDIVGLSLGPLVSTIFRVACSLTLHVQDDCAVADFR